MKSLCNNIHIVQGDFDTNNQYPSEKVSIYNKVINVGNFNIGIIHGHQIIPWND